VTRFFRSTDATLDEVRQTLDAAWSYPNHETKTETALPASADCPHDASGRVYLAVDDAYCEYVLPSQILPQLIAAGVVEEITEEQYRSVLPPV
jgi:hypothetical protein